MRRLALTFLLAFTTAGLAACGSSATPAPAAPSSATSASAAPSSAGGPSAPAAGSPASAGACAAAPAGSTPATTVTIKNFAYSPQPVEAKVGDVIAWKNDDSAPHSATMDDGACDTDTINAGALVAIVGMCAEGDHVQPAVRAGRERSLRSGLLR